MREKNAIEHTEEYEPLKRPITDSYKLRDLKELYKQARRRQQRTRLAKNNVMIRKSRIALFEFVMIIGLTNKVEPRHTRKADMIVN